MSMKEAKMRYLLENQGQTNQTFTIMKLETQLSQIKQEKEVNGWILYGVVGLFGFFMGFILKG